jgi:glycosyltransferase involved in cell wall biosynthesis
MNILIISLNFNPGHFSHLIANYKLFEDCGLTPYLYINKALNHMDKGNKFNKINNQGELRKLKKISIAIFWFPSLRNIIEIIRLRIFFKSKIIYIYHEPFDSIKSYYKAGFGFKRIIEIYLINLVNIPVILFSHIIVLPSVAALSLYQKKYTFLNKNYSLIPLLFDDESDFSLEESPKKFISYIGTIAPDHAFDSFVGFVNSAINNNWFPHMNFLIATKSKIPDKERRMLEPYLKSGKVVISEDHPMTNEEINHYYRKSLVVWNAYNRSMQSGVLPKAYMFGAAVIVLSRNANEFIKDHKTGIIIHDNNDVDEIKNAVEQIYSKKDFFFQNCRKMFLSTFYYKNKIDDYLSLFDKKS